MRGVWLWLGLAVLLVAAARWMTGMPGRSHAGPLPPLSADQSVLARRLERHVGVLAGQIGERNLYRRQGLEEAARYLEGALRDLGYAVERQEFAVATATVHNLEAERRGARRPEEVVVVGAHYDSVLGSPGADDNASGVGAVLELARLLAREELARSVRWLFFVNEEPPFFKGEAMGSLRYARRARERGERIVAMLSVESVGYYSDVEGSQHYPFPFGLLYPDAGNFVGFVGNLAARGLVRQTVASFRRQADFPCEGVAAPGWIPGIGWSDHWSFWQQGYPAVMITDTALFRYPAYHTEEDTPARVDYGRLARVVEGLKHVVAELGQEPGS